MKASPRSPSPDTIALSNYALTAPLPRTRPAAVTVIAGMQLVKAAILFSVVAITAIFSESTLAYIPHLREFIFFASHGKDPHGVAFLLLGFYSFCMGRGLLKLRRWARNSLVLGSSTTLLLWFFHVEYQVNVFTMPTLPAMALPAVYTLLLADFVVLAYLKYNYECDCAFAPGTQLPTFSS